MNPQVKPPNTNNDLLDRWDAEARDSAARAKVTIGLMLRALGVNGLLALLLWSFGVTEWVCIVGGALSAVWRWGEILMENPEAESAKASARPRVGQ